MEENIEAFKAAIEEVALNGKRVEGTYRKGKPGEREVIHFIVDDTRLWAVFEKKTGGFNEFLTAWKLSEQQFLDLKQNGNVT